LLDAPEIAPGRSGWAQLRLARPLALAKADRFILRQPSPSQTVGGGTVIDPYPRARHRQLSPQVIERLETLAHGDVQEVFLAALQREEPCPALAAIQASGLGAGAGREALAALLASGQVLALEAGEAAPEEERASGGHAPAVPPASGMRSGAPPTGGFPAKPETGRPAAWPWTGHGPLIVSLTGWQALSQRVLGAVGAYHRQFALRSGMPREELKSRLRLPPRTFLAVLDRLSQSGQLSGDALAVHLPDHRPAFSPEQQSRVDRLLEALALQPYTTPLLAEAEAQVGADVFAALLEQGVLTKVSSEVFFMTTTYQEMVDRVVAHLRANGKITLAEVRDLFKASRKYAQALMEHLDERRITRRVGDERILRVPVSGAPGPDR
jgi:selenocysteine-specific elongation factor